MESTNLSSSLWAVANLLRSDYKQSDYGKVILPFTLLRRLDCVLADNAGSGKLNPMKRFSFLRSSRS